MSSIDQRVVEMKINNKQFQSGVSSTMSALDKLKSALRFKDGVNAFSEINAAADKVGGLGRIAAAVDSIKSKFSVMGIVAGTAIGRITSSVIDLGRNTLTKIATGGIERALKIEEAQFKLRGLGQDIEKTMAVALAAVDGTAYGLDAAVDIAASFGATGMEAGQQMEDALRGVAGMSAMTGTSFEEIGGIFTQIAGEGKLSTMRMDQFATRGINAAASLAKELDVTEAQVRKMVTNGEIDFQTFADAMGNAFGEHATKANETYRGSLSNVGSALSRIGASFHGPRLEGARRVFVALKPVIDDVHKALGPVIDLYAKFVESGSDNKIKFLEGLDLGEGSNFAEIIANLVRAFSALRSIASSIVAPITNAWSAVFGGGGGGFSVMGALANITDLFASFLERLKMGVGVFDILTNVFKVFFYGLKGGGILLAGVAKGIWTLVGFIANLAMGLIRFIGTLASMGVAFGSWLLQTEEAQRIFRALSNIWDSVTETARNLGSIFQKVGFHISNAMASLRDGRDEQAVMALHWALATLGVSGETAVRWAKWLVDTIRNLGSTVREFIGQFSFASVAAALEDMAGGLSSLRDKLDFKIGINTSGLDEAKKKTAGLGDSLGWIGTMFKWLGGAIKTAAGWLGPVIMSIADFVGDMVAKAADYLRTLSFAEILALVNTGFFIMMYSTISGFVKNLSSLGKGFTSALDGIGGALKSFSKNESMATKIIKIAVAVAILAAAAYLLSEIDTAGLVVALGAMAVMLVELGLAMKLMSKIKFDNDAKVIKAAIALTLMSLAILVLAKAAENLSGLDWEAMAKGLVGVSVLLAGLALFTKFSDMGDGQTIRAALALMVLAVAIRLLAGSVDKLGNMDLGTLAKGLGAVGLLLFGFMAMTKVMNEAKLMSAALGLLILSAALLALSFSLKFYAKLDWMTLVVGLAKMGVALIGIGVAARALPSNLPITAAGLILVAAAMTLLVPALALIGSLPIETLIQGVLGIAGAILAIAAPMMLISNPSVLAGAAALVIVVGALYVLLPILITLGTLPWQVIVQGLLALAGIFVILGAAGLLLGPAVPVLIALAGIILALGVAVMIVGVGMALFGAGFAAMVAAFVAGGAILVSGFQALIMLLPLLGQQIGLAVVAFAVVIRDAGPQLVEAIETVIRSILTAGRNLIPDVIALGTEFVMGLANAVRDTAPQVAQRGLDMMLDIMQRVRQGVPPIVAEFLQLLLDILQELRTYVPQIVDEALKMMTEFLATVADNIGPIVDEATRLMVEFMDGIERNIPDLVESGERMVKTFIREVGAALLGGVPDLIEDGKSMASGIVSGLITGLKNGASAVGTAAKNMAKSAWDEAMGFLGIKSPSRKFMEIGRWSDEGLAKGLSDNTDVVTKASEAVGMEAIFAMKKSIAGLSDALDANIDMNPTIRPILDLTELQTAARRIDPMLQGRISATTSNRSANAAELGYLENRTAELNQQEAQIEHAREIKFEQHNHSPKALSRTEIYRQTKNQLSLLREV